MADDAPLNLETTYSFILEAARDGRFVSYGQLAEANGASWPNVRYQMPKHLDALVMIAAKHKWPLVTAIVVNQNDVETGKLEGTAREGFISAAREAGYDVSNPDEFVKAQQSQVFEWAKTAPTSLGPEGSSGSRAAGSGGPRFVHYFGPVLDALRSLGGEAGPKDVFDWVRRNTAVSESELSAVNSNGQSKFENKVSWARFYLTKAGLIDGKKHGVWALTSEGRETQLDQAQALSIFKDIRARFKPSEDDDEPAPEAVTASALFDDPARQFWFVGAAWGGDDQLERFLTERIWQNGYDDKFSEQVERMRPGDRIAIKSSFVQKYNVPFENQNKPVSCMRIKAIGTITENLGDRKTVKVDWQRLEPPRDWYLYTYRVTLVEADPSNDLARRLILFTFADVPQDFEFWLKVHYFAKKYRPLEHGATPPIFADEDIEEEPDEVAIPTYNVVSILDDGCFLSQAELENALSCLQLKKNLILQGPPGTGKTWLAKRLGYALIGSKDRIATRKRLRIVQFHPSLSYEDFVRGWRPSGNGNLALIDGIFLEVVQAAEAEPDRPFVLIIEEINRGNPAQVFGEMLTLLEDTKRHPDEAVELAYRREEGERVFIPPNLHVIGTINFADRSLALVDLALRRRFAFLTLEPRIGPAWRTWCADRAGLPVDVIDQIERGMNALNKEISDDKTLGPQFRVRAQLRDAAGNSQDHRCCKMVSKRGRNRDRSTSGGILVR